MEFCDVFTDFEKNGITSDLDEMDKIIIKLRESTGTIIVDFGEELELAQRNEEARQVLAGKKGQEKACCVFCKKNGENRGVYTTHSTKDITGQVTCPILQNYKCPLCGATGKKAHTIKYCPQKYSNNGYAPVVVMRARSNSTNSVWRPGQF